MKGEFVSCSGHTFFVRDGKAWMVKEGREEGNSFRGYVSTYCFIFLEDVWASSGCSCQSGCPFGQGFLFFKRKSNGLLELGRLGVTSVTHPPTKNVLDDFVALISEKRMRSGAFGYIRCREQQSGHTELRWKDGEDLLRLK